MKLQEIFNQLTHGEFKMLSIGGSTLNKIDPANYAEVLAHINLGLTALFTRFLLMEGRVIVRPIPGIRQYSLDSKFAVNDRRSREDVRYIIDTPTQPYNDDTVIRVERVLNHKEESLNLNVEGDEHSFFTPSLKSLRVPKEWTGDVVLVYRQNHPQIVIPVGPFLPERIEVELPYTHLEALLYFIASRVHNPLGMQNEFHMGNSYAMKYEQACMMLENKNIQADHTVQGSRFERNGWP